MLPPIKDVGRIVVFAREYESPTMIVIFENQDSYEVDGGMEIEQYLKMLGVPEELGVRDYVWNFYAAALDLKQMRMQPLTFEQAMSFKKQPEAIRF